MKRFLIFALLLAFAVPARGADIYWYKSGADAHWDTLLNNWWTNAAHTVQAGAIPTTGDFVYLLGATAPDAAPAAPVALIGFDTQGLGASLGPAITTNISIQTGGTLIMGDPAAPGSYVHRWNGTTATTGTFIFNDAAYSNGTVGDYATFNDAAYNNHGTVGNYATFNNWADNEDTGTVGDYATFNDNTDSGGIVGDYATFSDSAGSWGTVGDYTTFNSAGTLSGTWLGTTYYIGAAAVFGDSCIFSGTPPIAFEFTGTTADLIGTITSDGGTTPVAYNISVNAPGLTVTAQRNFSLYNFTMTAGTFAGNSQTYTVGAGGFTYTAGTLTGDLDITVGTATITAIWNTTTNQFRTLTVNASITPSGYIRCKALAGSAAMVTVSGKNPLLYPAADDFWTYTGALSGAGGANIYLTASQSNAAAIEIDTSSPMSIRSDDFTLSAPGGVTCGALEIRSTSANKTSTVSCTGPLSCASVTLGAIVTNHGALELGSGADHTISGAVIKGSTGTANALTLGGRMRLGGDVTLAGITTDFGQSRIDATAAITIDGTTATGISNGGAVTSGTIVTGRGGMVTFTEMDTNWTAGNPPILARNFTDDGTNGGKVQPLAPHWLTGMRP